MRSERKKIWKFNLEMKFRHIDIADEMKTIR